MTLWIALTGAVLAAGIATVIEGFILIGRTQRITDAAEDANDYADRLFRWCSDTFAPAFDQLLERLPPGQPATAPELPAQPKPAPGPRTVPTAVAVDTWLEEQRARLDKQFTDAWAQIDADMAKPKTTRPRKGTSRA